MTKALLALGSALLAALAISATAVAADTPAPVVSIGKLEKIATYGGGYLPGPITGLTGQTIAYEVLVTNTGSVRATVNLNDSSCDGLLAQGAQTLEPGQWVTYTCTHKLGATDGPSYTNMATATATSDDGQTFTTSPAVAVTNIGQVAGAHKTVVHKAKKHKKAKKISC